MKSHLLLTFVKEVKLSFLVQKVVFRVMIVLLLCILVLGITLMLCFKLWKLSFVFCGIYVCLSPGKGSYFLGRRPVPVWGHL